MGGFGSSRVGRSTVESAFRIDQHRRAMAHTPAVLSENFVMAWVLTAHVSESARSRRY